MKVSPDDPFRERVPAPLRARLNVLGAQFAVTATDPAVIGLAVEAFGGLPRHQIVRPVRRFDMRLVLAEDTKELRRGSTPPRPALSAGVGMLCATIDAANFAVVDVRGSRALVSVSQSLVRERYHARYELVELAFLTLASRAQSLVPLHAACVGAGGYGVLLMGASGAGKSTLALHAFAGGLDLLSEDSAFVALDGLRVTGAPNYVYVAPRALAFLPPGNLKRSIACSPIIVRRSGARKHQVDLRKLSGGIARTPLRLKAAVFLTRRSSGRGSALEPLARRELLARLRIEQPYASARPNWSAFERRIVAVPAYEMRRAQHPDAAVRLLRDLLLKTPLAS